MRRKITVLIVISAAFACLLIWNLMPRASARKPIEKPTAQNEESDRFEAPAQRFIETCRRRKLPRSTNRGASVPRFQNARNCAFMDCTRTISYSKWADAKPE